SEEHHHPEISGPLLPSPRRPVRNDRSHDYFAVTLAPILVTRPSPSPSPSTFTTTSTSTSTSTMPQLPVATAGSAGAVSDCGSSSACAIHSRPSAFFTAGFAYSCGPRCTWGMTSKLWCTGGDGSVHSRVPISHGFTSAFEPANTLRKKLITKVIWLAP